jgi:trimethylamine--corrinoid protein Co-methyltransferase
MARRGRRQSETKNELAPSLKAIGGTYKPLGLIETKAIADAAVEIMCTVGFSECPEPVAQELLRFGCQKNGDRVYFVNNLIDEVLDKMSKVVTLYSRSKKDDLHVGKSASFVGTGGASPYILDIETGVYRASTLNDLYDSARLCEQLDHIQFFSRSLVARDINNSRDLDLNTVFACILGTQKHIMTSASEPNHVAEIAEICYSIAGSETEFRAQPFVSFNINHAVPPLRFHAESFAVMKAAIQKGFPVHANVFGQLGASSPVTTAGSVAQTLAEALAGVVYAHCIDPEAKVIAGPRPMITDLRTGGFSGGSGEQALATAMCAQVMRYWDLPCSAIAGATDSKSADAQSGFEKSLTVNTAIQAGTNLITQAAGTQAGLMGVSLKAYVIDNDMLGSLLRANVTPIVSEETLALASILEVIQGEGHFLGQAETYARMKSDFLYPEISDRRSIDEWGAGKQETLEDKAKVKVLELLENKHENNLNADLMRTLIKKYGLSFDLLSLQPNSAISS